MELINAQKAQSLLDDRIKKIEQEIIPLAQAFLEKELPKALDKAVGELSSWAWLRVRYKGLGVEGSKERGLFLKSVEVNNPSFKRGAWESKH